MKTRDIALVALGAASQSPRTEYVTKTVHEHRAPTDDSIRLAKEYEEKAWKSVTDRILVDVPEIEAKVVICEKDYASREKRILFTVNGRKVDVRLPESFDQQFQIVREMSDAISAAIVRQIFQGQKL